MHAAGDVASSRASVAPAADIVPLECAEPPSRQLQIVLDSLE